MGLHPILTPPAGCGTLKPEYIASFSPGRGTMRFGGEKEATMLHQLCTPRGESVGTQPWQAYPRPQLRRDSYINLNGSWDFAVSETEPRDYDRTILVPFCPESRLSGIGEHFAEGAKLWYRRSLTLPEGFNRGRVLLHFGAVDQEAEVFVNGKAVGSHQGGYEAFCFDITDVLEPENQITVCCRDDLNDKRYPYGKQVMDRGGMWYTPVSGIWQTVWVESVPETHIHKLGIENRGTSVTIDVGQSLAGKVTVAGLGEYTLENGRVTITPENPRLWSPEDPYLYEFTVEAGEDRVESYFALRVLEVRKIGAYQRLCLNGKPYFFHGLLDQGYWPEGLLTPPAPESYADDILAMKKLGFNTLRKHIKVEPEEFYYQCDRLGMVVFQDMVNNGRYSFVKDTALPTVARLSQWAMPDKFLNRDPRIRKMFLQCMEAEVKQLKNHPSILQWTIFNEAWGQFDSDNVYEQFIRLDDTRWVDATSGWFRQKKSPIDGRHVYFRKVELEGGKKPLVLKEFGGYTYKADGHIFNSDKAYGYGTRETLAELNEAVRKLYLEEILPCVRKGLCGSIYTQVSDVEDEINGLLTYDRRVEKLQPEVMLPVAQALQEAVQA